jgi:hypothetical protein
VEDMKYVPDFVERIRREETSWKYDTVERAALKHIVQKFIEFRLSPSVKVMRIFYWTFGFTKPLHFLTNSEHSNF